MMQRVLSRGRRVAGGARRVRAVAAPAGGARRALSTAADEEAREAAAASKEAAAAARKAEVEKMAHEAALHMATSEEAETERVEVPASTETIEGEATSHTFQAETRQLLDIVAKSVYTDREVFVRELISNASDALEKLRYLQGASEDGAEVVEPERELEMHIVADPEARTLTIQDSGVGMTAEDLQNHLGVIARSGSKAFVQKVGSDAGADVIGQFGVGFYSVFMVADRVDVYSRSSVTGETHLWRSDGTGQYELAAAKGAGRGTKIVLHLREDAAEFADVMRLEAIVRKYSNFVGFPIYLNGARQNTVKALWAMRPSEVSEAEYNEFFKFVSSSWENPQWHLHFATDVPIDIKALIYVPKRHMEKFGMGRLEPGVSLYCRKVLISHQSADILPDWLRFCKGVVDSEDLPLNLSRESMQDTMLLKRISRVLTKKVLRALDGFAREDPEEYKAWIAEFGQFIKEGVCTDPANKNDAAKLLRYESSKFEAGQTTSLDEYVSRMAPEQRSVYFVVAENRELALRSPYYEHFRDSGVEVLFMYSHLDDFVMRGLGSYSKKEVKSIEAPDAAGEVAPSDEARARAEREEDEAAEAAAASGGVRPPRRLEEAEKEELVAWLQKHALVGKVSGVALTQRSLTAPAILTGHESASVRSMMRHVNAEIGMQQQQQKLEVNASHPIMRGLFFLKGEDPTTAQMVAEQVFDNALIAAGLLDNAQTMIPRMTDLLTRLAARNAPTK